MRKKPAALSAMTDDRVSQKAVSLLELLISGLTYDPALCVFGSFPHGERALTIGRGKDVRLIAANRKFQAALEGQRHRAKAVSRIVDELEIVAICVAELRGVVGD